MMGWLTCLAAVGIVCMQGPPTRRCGETGNPLLVEVGSIAIVISLASFISEEERGSGLHLNVSIYSGFSFIRFIKLATRFRYYRPRPSFFTTQQHVTVRKIFLRNTYFYAWAHRVVMVIILSPLEESAHRQSHPYFFIKLYAVEHLIFQKSSTPHA